MEDRRPSATIQSGFPLLDLLTGGYRPGTLTAVRYLGHEDQAEILQDFIERQAYNLASTKGPHPRKTLLVTLQMNEQEIVKSLFLNKGLRKESGDETLLKTANKSLLIAATDREEPFPKLGTLLKNLGKWIADTGAGALILDAADLILTHDEKPCGDAVSRTIRTAVRENASRMLETGLLETAKRYGIPVILSDYDNVLAIHPLGDGTVTDIELTQDVEGATQAFVTDGRRSFTVRRLYHGEESAGGELILSALSHYAKHGEFPPACDRIQQLANAGAAVALQIDSLIGNKKDTP